MTHTAQMLNKWSRKKRETLMRGKERENDKCCTDGRRQKRERERGAERMMWGRERDIEQMRGEEREGKEMLSR